MADEPSWKEILERTRAAGFVGRTEQLRAIAASFDGTAATRVHLVHGPGGIGKTALLDAAERLGRGRARIVHRLDARDMVCSVASVSGWYESVVGPDPPGLLLIDGYELLIPLDGWFRTAFLPALASTTVTVLAGRTAPSDDWWLDPGWRRLAATHELDPLGAPDSDSLLALLGVPAGQRIALAGLAKGHPLVLVLLAEASRRRAGIVGFDDAPDVVAQLCRIIMDDVPGRAHRQGLASCAHAARLTEDLLRRTIGERAGEVWDWLASRPYVRHGAVGLYLHDVVREVFEAEFRHRSPDAYQELHRSVRGYFAERLSDPGELHPERAAAEIILLNRRGPLADQAAEVRGGELPPVTRASAADQAWIVDLIRRDEGERSAAVARRWFATGARGLYRAGAPDGPAAFSYHGYLAAAPEELNDPVATAIWDLVAHDGPLRPGEQINVMRFSGASGGSRDPLMVLVTGVASLLEWRREAAAWTFFTTSDPDHYAAYIDYLGVPRLFTVDLGHGPIGGWGWDRRRFSVDSMFTMIAQRELSGETGPPPTHLVRPAPLSRPDFDLAVRAALAALGRPDRLADSALLDSALVPDSDVAALATTLKQAIAGLADEPRGAEHRRVLERTYLRAVPSQEVAAELLDLPFSTYRRHLAQAVQRLCDVLWAVEIGTVPPGRSGV